MAGRPRPEARSMNDRTTVCQYPRCKALPVPHATQNKLRRYCAKHIKGYNHRVETFICVRCAAGFKPYTTAHRLCQDCRIPVRAIKAECRAIGGSMMAALYRLNMNVREQMKIAAQEERRRLQNLARSVLPAAGYVICSEGPDANGAHRYEVVHTRCGTGRSVSQIELESIVECTHRWCYPVPERLHDLKLLYLIQKPSSDALKIGVTSWNSNRLAEFQAFGWNVLEIWRLHATPDYRRNYNVHPVFGIERMVVDYFRGILRAGYGGTMRDYPNTGITESAPLSKVRVVDLIRIIDRLVAQPFMSVEQLLMLDLNQRKRAEVMA